MSQTLSIGMMVRSYIPAPKPDDLVYAPISLMIQLAKHLADKGHRITIFAPVGSQLNYPNITTETLNLTPFATSEAEFQQFLNNNYLLAHGFDSLQDWHMAQAMFERASMGEFDVLHFHHPEVGMPLARNYPDVPTIYTLHDPVDRLAIEAYRLHLSPNQGFVAISHQQARQAEGLPIRAVIHHGHELPPLNPAIEPDNGLLFVGRIIPEKGVKEAIFVAQQTNRDLTIIGPTFKSHQKYFDQEIAPHLGEKIRYLGHLNHSDLSSYYQRSAAVLTPIQWDEPFGLTTIEAMANGAPVIALNRGAVPELIIDQKTGFIVDTLDEMIEAVGRLASVDRQNCRQHVRDNFSCIKSFDALEDVFVAAIEGGEASGLLENTTAKLREGTALPQG